MTETNIIKPLKYLDRLQRYTMIPHYFNLPLIKKPLDKMILARKLAVSDLIFPAIFIAAREKEGTKATKREKQAIIQATRKRSKEIHREEIKSFVPILLNQALVMVCTIFDVFLVDSLKAITQTQPNALKQLVGEEKAMKTDLVIDLANKGRVFEFIQERALNTFDHDSIEGKIKTLDKMGVNISDIFSFKQFTREVQKLYPDARKLLFDTYKKRHGIVHADQLPLTAYTELSDIAAFFSRLILGFGISLADHFHMTTDWDMAGLGIPTYHL